MISLIVLISLYHTIVAYKYDLTCNMKTYIILSYVCIIGVGAYYYCVVLSSQGFCILKITIG